MSQNAITSAITGTTVPSLANVIQQATQVSIPNGSITDPNAITVDKLAPNNYLTIVWRDKISGSIYHTYEDLATSQAEELEYTTQLNNAINNTLNNTNQSYIGNRKYVNIESIAKYLSQNILPSGTKRVVVNALIGMITGDQRKLTNNAINLTVNVFGEIAKKTANAIGFSDPHEAFASIASENSIGFMAELAKQTKNKLTSFVRNKLHKTPSKINSTTTENKSVKYVGLLLGITTSDTESYDITIPRRKVENGSDYTTHLLPQPFKKEFNVKLTNKVLSSRYDYEREIDNIEKVKNKLIEIAQSYTTFDIYIRLSSGHMYKKTNVVFSSLSFTKDEGSGNGYECSFTIEPIEEFLTKTFVSDRKYFPTVNKKGYSDGVGGSGATRGYGAGSGAGLGVNNGNKTTGIRHTGIYTGDGGKLKLATTEYDKSLGHVQGNFDTPEQGAKWLKKNNKINGDNYDMVYYTSHPDDSPDLMGVSRDKMTYIRVYDGNKAKMVMVPRKYTRTGYDSHGSLGYVLKDGFKYSNGTFSNKNGSVQFKVYDLQSKKSNFDWTYGSKVLSNKKIGK